MAREQGKRKLCSHWNLAYWKTILFQNCRLLAISNVTLSKYNGWGAISDDNVKN